MGYPRGRRIFRTLILFVLSGSAIAGAVAGEVSLGVAANFTDTTRELAKRFETETGHTVSASYGSTGKLYAQIKNGAPFDVFMAADALRPALIEEEQAGVPGTRFTYARGKLALWSPTVAAFDNAEALWLARRAERAKRKSPGQRPELFPDQN